MTTSDQLRTALLGLTTAQQAAAEALASGATHAETAEAANVARETVTRWAGHHPGFRAAFDLYRATLAAEQANRVRRIRSKALEDVEARLNAGSIDPLAVLRSIPPPTDAPALSHTAAELLDTETRRTLTTLLPVPPPRGFEAQLDHLNNPPPSEIERATSVTMARLADASGISTETPRSPSSAT